MKQKIKKRFTLIELLVVIAIIAILASMLLPALKNAKDQARSMECKSKLKNLSQAMVMYANDWKGFYPQYSSVPWDVQIADYVGYKSEGAAVNWGPPLYHCPNGNVINGYEAGASRGYCYNQNICTNLDGINGRAGGFSDDSQQMLLVDAWAASVAGYEPENGHGGDGYCEYITTSSVSGSMIRTSESSLAKLAWRHGSKSNFVNFARKDGSVDISGKGIVVGASWLGKKLYWYKLKSGSYYYDGFHTP